MKTSKTILLLLGLLLVFFAQAQVTDDEIDPMPIKLKGQILNLEDGAPVPYAHVVNLRSHVGTTTNETGYFSMDMMNVDSLVISVLGFKQMSVKVDPNYKENSVFIIRAQPIRFPIGEVKVTGEKNTVNLGLPQGKALNIDPHLRGDSYNSKPPIIAAFFSPLSFMQYHLSRKEKEKRETRKAILTEAHWQSISKYYTKDVVMELTGLDEDHVDDFMVYFNSKGVLNQTSSEYDVRSAIVEQYDLYKQNPPE